MSAPVTGRRRRGRVPLIALFVFVGLLMAMPMAAWGAWSDVSTVQTTSAVGSDIPAPSNLDCRTEGPLPLLQSVELSWDEPSSGPPDGYVIEAETARGLYVISDEIPGDTLTFHIDTGLLDDVVAALLSLLLGGAQPEVTVSAMHGGWQSEPTDPVRIRIALLGLGGLVCA